MSTRTLLSRVSKLKSNIIVGIDIESIIKRRMYYLKRNEPIPAIGSELDTFKLSPRKTSTNRFDNNENDLDEIEQRIKARMNKLDEM